MTVSDPTPAGQSDTPATLEVFVRRMTPTDIPGHDRACVGCGAPIADDEPWLAALVASEIVHAAHVDSPIADPTLIAPGGCAEQLHQIIGNVGRTIGIHQGLRPGIAPHTWYLGDRLLQDDDVIAMQTEFGQWIYGLYFETTGAAGPAPYLGVPVAGWCGPIITIAIPPTAYLRYVMPLRPAADAD